MRIVAVAAMLACIASAQDGRLAALHETLVELRAQQNADGALPSEKLTVAKHQLRDWIETQLESLQNEWETKALEDRINQALKPISVSPVSDSQSHFGSLGGVGLKNEVGLLIVTTGVGVFCQFDHSAYGYRRTDGRWQRVWEWEQNDYRENRYDPQLIDDILVFQPNRAGHNVTPPLVLALSNSWGCASTWHNVSYRVWRLEPTGQKLLLDGSELAWLRKGTYIVGSIGQRPDEPFVNVLVEFTERSVDVVVHNREAVRHFLIDGDRVTRVEPVALSPRDFVDEWLTRPWDESRHWSASADLSRRYRSFHDLTGGDYVGGWFGETMHCSKPDLWQVALAPLDAKKNFDELPPQYFLVRWRPPFRFTMVEVRERPWPHCTEKDPNADEWRTLFSTQDWR